MNVLIEYIDIRWNTWRLLWDVGTTYYIHIIYWYHTSKYVTVANVTPIAPRGNRYINVLRYYDKNLTFFSKKLTKIVIFFNKIANIFVNFFWKKCQVFVIITEKIYIAVSTWRNRCHICDRHILRGVISINYMNVCSSYVS